MIGQGTVPAVIIKQGDIVWASASDLPLTKLQLSVESVSLMMDLVMVNLCSGLNSIKVLKLVEVLDPLSHFIEVWLTFQ